MSDGSFDPNKLPRYCVILHPYKFESERAQQKIFVVLGHKNGHAICIKATSQVQPYLASEARMAGCVFFEKGEVEFFPLPTAIQPGNQFPIPHEDICSANDKGIFKVLGNMPVDFHERLVRAIQNSVTIAPRQRQRLLDFLK